MRNNSRFFCTPENFIRLNIGTNNNIIEIGYLENVAPSDTDIKNNMVFLSFRGVELEQILEADLDVSGNEDKFSYVSDGDKNIIKLAVDKINVDTSDKARKYITGLLIDYMLEDMVYLNQGQTPLYYF